MEDLRLQELVVFLVAAGLVIPLGKRLRLSPVLGFLIMGLLVGPNGIGRFVTALPWLEFAVISDVDGVRALSELGIVFLLFMIGLGLSPDRLIAMRRLVAGLGSLQITVTGAAIAIATIAYGFGNSPAASVILGGCLALSSTAIVSQLLIEQGRFGTTVGRTTFAVLLAPPTGGLRPGDALHHAITRTLSQNAACLPYLRIHPSYGGISPRLRVGPWGGAADTESRQGRREAAELLRLPRCALADDPKHERDRVGLRNCAAAAAQ